MNMLKLGLKKWLLIITTLIVVLLLLNFSKAPKNPSNKISSSIFGPTLSLFYSFDSGIRNIVSTYINLVDTIKNTKIIKKKNDELMTHIQTLNTLQQENKRLNALLDFKTLSALELQAAQVIGQDLSANHQMLFLNKGEKHGIKKNLAVVSPEGVVGYIINVNRSTSQVLLVTDRAASIDAIVSRTGARGIISGKKHGVSRLKYLERISDAQNGDIILTSGLQGFFPKGFPIGKVTKIQKNEYGISAEALIDPFVNLHRLEAVFIIKNPRKLTETDTEAEI